MNCNRKFLVNVAICLAPLMAMVLLFSFTACHAFAAPQSDEEMILQLGPDPEIFTLESVELTLNGWKWQSELSIKQQNLVEETTREWQERYMVIQSNLDNLQRELAKAGLSFPLDNRTVQNIETRINSTKGELAALVAELRRVKAESDSLQKELRVELEAKEMEVQLLNKKLALTKDEYDHMKALRKANSISSKDVTVIQIKLADMEAQFVNARSQLELVKSRLGSDKSADVLAITERQQYLENQSRSLIEQRELIKKLKPVQQIGKLNTELAMIQKMIELSKVHQFELELENTKNLALIELAEKRLANHKKKEAGEDKK